MSIRGWQDAGFGVDVFFLRLESVELAIARVAARMQQGGHSISESVIRRRYLAGWYNWEQRYRPLVDSWRLYDNSGEKFRLVEQGENL